MNKSGDHSGSCPAHQRGVAGVPVGIEVGEGIAAREDQVGEGEAVEEQQRQRDQQQRDSGFETIQGRLS